MDGEALLARLGTFLGVKREADLLRQAALIDVGSGLYTLHGLTRRLEEMGSDALRHGRPLACVALGMAAPPDHADETAPVRLGRLLKQHGRTSDAIAHLGGGEYLLVAPDTAGSGVVRLVDRLESALQLDGAAGERPLLAGYSAVDDARAAEIQPAVLMDRATTALRFLVGQGRGAHIVAYEGLPAPVAT